MTHGMRWSRDIPGNIPHHGGSALMTCPRCDRKSCGPDGRDGAGAGRLDVDKPSPQAAIPELGQGSRSAHRGKQRRWLRENRADPSGAHGPGRGSRSEARPRWRRGSQVGFETGGHTGTFPSPSTMLSLGERARQLAPEFRAIRCVEAGLLVAIPPGRNHRQSAQVVGDVR